MATAGPGVRADLTAKEAASPADGWRFGAAAGNTNANVLRTATARRIDAERRLNRRGRTATGVAGVGVIRTRD